MALIRGLFARKDATRGTTPVEARKALSGIFTPAASFGARAGVLSGMTVTGMAAWSYGITAGHLATSRSVSDGVILSANDGVATVATTAAPGTGGRIDLIWVKHSDVDMGDATSDNVFGVTQGVVSGSPVAPALPTGAFELGRAQVMAGATGTSHANVTITNSAVRTGLRGGTIEVPDTAARLALGNPVSGSALYVHETSTGNTWVNTGTAWTILHSPGRSFVAAWTSSGTAPTLGNGTKVSRYSISGGVVFFSIELTIGTTTTPGTGAYYILGLPVPAAGQVLVNARALDQGSRTYIGAAHTISTTQIRVEFEVGSGPPAYWGPTTPFVPAATDKLTFAGSYEAA